MGWKTVKEHYKIGHNVCVEDGNICIGSPYIHDIFVFSSSGTLLKGKDETGDRNKLFPWIAQMMADSQTGKLAELIATQDVFGPLISVWTHDYTKVIEKKAEAFGYPHVCTDGTMQEGFYPTFNAAKRGLMKTCVSRIGNAIERMNDEIESLEQRQEGLYETFLGLTSVLGLEDDESFQLLQLEYLKKRRHERRERDRERRRR